MLFDTLRAEIAHANNSTASGRQGRTRGTHASSLSGATDHSTLRTNGNLNETLVSLANHAIAMAQNLQRHATEFTRTAQRGIDLLNERAQTRGTSIAHATQEQAIHLARVAQQQATIIAEQAMQHLNRLQQRMASNEASTPEPGYRPPSPIRTNCTPNMPMNLSEETRLNMPRDLTEEITDMPMNIPEAAIPYATQFQQLREMGYTDERRLIRYLRLFDGDVTLVVDSMESAFNIDSDDDDGLYN
jgi:nitrogen fixation/metabolism regulation signal transduction histidine kinase